MVQKIIASFQKKVRPGRVMFAVLAGLLVASAQGAVVNWSPSPSPGITGYRLYYGLPASTPKVVDVGLTTSWNVNDLLAGGTYEFYVTAYNYLGMESAPCPAVVFSELSSIKISWPPTTVTNLAGYKLYYAPEGGAYSKVLMGTQTNWTLANISGDQTYNFYVSTHDTTGAEVERYLSASRTVATNGPTTPVVLLPTQVQVSWSKSTLPSAASYRLFYSIAGGAYYGIPASSRTNWVIGDVIAGKSCAMYVAVYDLLGVEKERYNTMTVPVSATGPTPAVFLQGPVNLSVINPTPTNPTNTSGSIINPTPTTSASYVTIDRTTLGSWKGKFGLDGYMVLGDGSVYPSNLVVSATGKSYVSWENPTANTSALQKSVKATERIASAWYANESFVVKLPFTDTKIHRLALYCLDYENKGLKQYIDIFNLDTGSILTSYYLSNFTKGAYVRFDVRGKVGVKFRREVGASAVVSGLFFDTFESKSLTPNVVLNWDGSTVPNLDGYNVYSAQAGGPTNKFTLGTTNSHTLTNLVAGTTYSVWVAARNANGLELEVYAPITVTAAANATAPTLSLARFAGASAAAYVGVDRSTLGEWRTNYGTDGYMVLGDGSIYPTNLVVSSTGKSWVLWESPSANTSSLRKTVKTHERIAGAWYAPESFTVKLAFDDSAIHRVAFYCFDFEQRSLLQRVEIFDLATGATLSTGQLSQFSKGAYLIFDVKGKVGVRFKKGDGDKAVVSGIFFDKPPGGNS